MKLDQLGTIIAIIVGVYGIIHTTYLLIRGSLKERRKVKILCEETNEAWAEAIKSDSAYSVSLKQLSPTIPVLRIEAINSSPEPNIITAMGFYLSNREEIKPEVDDIKFPRRIEAGNSIYFTFRITELQSLIADKTYEPLLSKFLNRIKKRTEGIRKLISALRIRFPIYFAEAEGTVEDLIDKEIENLIDRLEKEDSHKRVASVEQESDKLEINKTTKETKGVSKKEERVIHFRSPIFFDTTSLVEDRLARFDEENQWERDLEEERVYWLKYRLFFTYVFIRDIDGYEYSSPVPQFLENYGLKKSKKRKLHDRKAPK